ncbi:cytochrome P450 [Massariosphaeria phaeospora]|uniref:Cytochrome P450 n=1 Tax=Massariosphaeria phaeospora TaxID=100035 RepID=A0A7C8M8Z0_9PLEO|nr:cytochrome P450 [Massariosphaeria phaeospora]
MQQVSIGYKLSDRPSRNTRPSSPTDIRSTLSSQADFVQGPKLSACKYLRACIDEALRLCHPIPGGAVIAGPTYPAGTVVGCAAWAMGRDEAVYRDWNLFPPERWMPSSHAESPTSEADVKELKKDFHPFSMGAMNCAGQTLPLLELMLVGAKTVWGTDFRLAPRYHCW